MAADFRGLVRASMALRGESTELWLGFVGAMGEYALAMQSEMMKCDPSLLPRAQGMALMATEIAGIIADAPALYDKMTKPPVRPDARRTPFSS